MTDEVQQSFLERLLLQPLPNSRNVTHRSVRVPRGEVTRNDDVTRVAKDEERPVAVGFRNAHEASMGDEEGGDHAVGRERLRVTPLVSARIIGQQSGIAIYDGIAEQG